MSHQEVAKLMNSIQPIKRSVAEKKAAVLKSMISNDEKTRECGGYTFKVTQQRKTPAMNAQNLRAWVTKFVDENEDGVRSVDDVTKLLDFIKAERKALREASDKKQVLSVTRKRSK